jgi:hypothetical protein
MNYQAAIFFSLSIIIAAVLGGIRYQKIDPVYRPFLFLIWLSLINEILSIVLAYTIRNNVVNNNIFTLLQSLLILWQFRNWKSFQRYRRLLMVLIVLVIASWTIEISFVHTINDFTAYSLILHAFMVVLLSISMINVLLLREYRSLLKNPIFLICTGFILYFTMSILTEIFWQYGLNENKDFRLSIYRILQFINLFSNLIYALAVLWMPAKPRFILPSSSPAL